MKRTALALSMLLAAAGSVAGAYSYYYTESFFWGTINSSAWTQNGYLTASSGLLTTSSYGGSLISTLVVPDGTSEYEVFSNLAANPGSVYADTYVRATPDAFCGTYLQGSAYVVRALASNSSANTVTVYRFVNGANLTQLFSATTGKINTVRVVNRTTGIWIYVNNTYLGYVGDNAITSGKPGIGVYSGGSGAGIASVALGGIDRVAPSAVPAGSIQTSGMPDRIDMHWPAAADDANGIGVSFYQIFRNGAYVGATYLPEFTDATVAPGTTYNYSLVVQDFHLNSATTAFSAASTSASTADPNRRTGVRPHGTYYGGMGENIDLASGNLNFTIPLIKTKARSGWSVPFSLNYNSDNWRQDSGGTWNLGRDVGYGHGWRLLAGSITPYYTNSVVDHYVFSDSTGAEYRLDVNTGGVWTGKEGVYVSYEGSTSRLYFNDGSFWYFGCRSAGTEADAGTTYPTLMQDSNGNLVRINYATGAGVSWSNSSARITNIEDVRGVNAYAFSYAGTPPHLTGITSNMGSGENLGFTTVTGNLSPPFGSSPTVNTSFLTAVTMTGPGLSYGLTQNGYGELTKVVFPYGGYIAWDYYPFTYSPTRTQREVQTRYISKDGTAGSQKAFTIGRDSGDSSRAYHLWADVHESGGNGSKVWVFMQVGGEVVASDHDNRHWNPSPVSRLTEHYNWSQSPNGTYYIGSVLTTMEYGTANVLYKQTAQTVDDYGNLTSISQWKYQTSASFTGAADRVYTNTYQTNANYTSRYIRNRLLTSTLAANGQNITLVTNSYDTSQIYDLPNVSQHDSAYGTGFYYRGNLTQSTTLGGTAYNVYDIGGNVKSASDQTGLSISTSYQQSTNYTVPSTITVGGSLTRSMQWNSALGMTSDSGPNGDTASTLYDSYARPYRTTSKTGIVNYYSYTNSPATVTAATEAVSGRPSVWTRTTLDGFGRTVKVETGSGATTSTPVSVVETLYDSCGCTPMGKTKQVSMPRANGASAVWTVNNYDGLGRTLSVVAPGGATKTYEYIANTVKATDEAGKWKKYWMDAFGNLTQVEEPNPAGSSFFTYYTYDQLNHLTGVNMPRPTGTQTRAFNYGTPPGHFLLSATNPETGTVSYAYSNGRLSTKTDAKGQQVQYSYDGNNRVSQVRHYVVQSGGGLIEDTCQQVNFTYDSNTGFNYLAGRLATRSYSVCALPDQPAAKRTDFIEMYGYTQAGQVTVKRLRVSRNGSSRDLDASWTYDRDRMTGVTYPTGYQAGPSGGSYTFGYDAMGRPYSMADASTNPLISTATYGPAGELLTLTAPGYSQPNYLESRVYNARLQLTSLNGATFNYGPDTTNNGRIASETISGETVTYSYDSLNRLISANGSGWGQGFVYDGFGNLREKTVLAGSAPTFSAAFDAGTNRQVGVSYDANGNQLTDRSGVPSLGYDVENRLVFARNGWSSPGWWYGYDPDNRRVYLSKWSYVNYDWSLNSEQIVYYGIGGQKLGTYTLTFSGSTMQLTATGYNVYFGSKLVRKIDGTGSATSVQPDRLGSFGKFYPYGEQRSGAAGDDTEKFSTYYRDQDTGLDYAVNRYYSPTPGRFMTADPGPAALSEPRSWNRYSYSWTDPANLNDPNGLLPGGTVLENGCMQSPFSTAGGSIDTSTNCPPGYIWVGGSPGSASVSPLAQVHAAVTALEGFSDLDISVSPLGGGRYAVNFASPGGIAIAGTVCAAQPQICVAGGVVVTIYVTGRYLPALIDAIRRGINARDLAPVRYDPYSSPKDDNGDCEPPDPEKFVKWRGSDEFHWHWIEWNQTPDCMNIPKWRTGPDPGPGYREIPR